MAAVFSERDLMTAMARAELAHPPPEVGVLSKPVSVIAGVFANMLYLKISEIEVVDERLCLLINGFLKGSDK